MALASQTKFATAVSEICRNVIEHAGNGNIQFGLASDEGFNYLEALISDRGRGIGNLDNIYTRSSYGSGTSERGFGIQNSRKLVDYFHIKSESEQGTIVTLRKRIPAKAPILTKAILEQWVRELDNDGDISPYAEIKRQYMQQLELLEQLRLRNLEAEQQLLEIGRLNMQLQQSNTEIQSLSEEREKKNLMLQKMNEDLDAFAHTVSHDLRAPLQNINGLATLLENCILTDNKEESAVVLPMLRDQAYKMERMIAGILAYSLAGHHNLRKQLVDVRVVLHNTLETLFIPEHFSIKLPSELPMLYTQEIFLDQIFGNLIGNAIKYHDNPNEVHIEIGYKLHADYLLFSVQDNGPGIAKADQQQIFTMYESLGHNFTRPDSSGLGLAIVKRILEEKGSQVWVESEGRGSCFYFTWPVIELVQENDPE